MKALITGASSGLGRSFAYLLAEQGYDLILVARREYLLDSIKNEVSVNVKNICLDLSVEDNVNKLLNEIQDEEIDLVINNAGFGLLGDFSEINLNKEIEMINLNVLAVHMITKYFVNKFKLINKGTICNVASTAAFSSGPLFATYYATKNYVIRLTDAIRYELKKSKSKVVVTSLCPGPMDTEFNNVAGGKFKTADNALKIASYTLKKLTFNKAHIIPGFKNKLTVFGIKILPSCIINKINYKYQKNKINSL